MHVMYQFWFYVKSDNCISVLQKTSVTMTRVKDTEVGSVIPSLGMPVKTGTLTTHINTALRVLNTLNLVSECFYKMS